MPEAIGNSDLSFMQILTDLFAAYTKDRFIRVKWTTGKQRTVSQNALFHMWCDEISTQLRSMGRDAWTKEHTKACLKKTFLGDYEAKLTDVTTGEVLCVMRPKETSKLPVGEMSTFMQQVEAWAFNAGLTLTIPEDSEYMNLKQQEVA